MKRKEAVESAILNLIGGKKTDYERYFKKDVVSDDIFLGIPVPELRKLMAIEYKEMDLEDVDFFFTSKYHDYRHFAGFVIVKKMLAKENIVSKAEKKAFFDYFMAHLDYVDTWDLIDNAARDVVGKWCFDNDQDDIMYELSHSKKWNERRLAAISSFYHTKNGRPEVGYKIAETIHSNSNEDLMHKALGWLLKDMHEFYPELTIKFLDKHWKEMTRTSVRYAIEKFDKEDKDRYK